MLRGLAAQGRERIEKGRLAHGGKTSRLVRDPSADAGNLFVHRVSSDNRVRCLARDLVNKLEQFDALCHFAARGFRSVRYC